MKICKNINNQSIYCTEEGVPEEYELLADDPSITKESKKYVIGAKKGKAIFDTARIDSDFKNKQKTDAQNRLDQIDKEFFTAFRKDDKEAQDALKEEAAKLEEIVNG